MKIVNKTGRTIALYINEHWETFFPEGAPVVIKEKLCPNYENEIQISQYMYEGINGLPDREKDTIIVVDKDIALRCWAELREDVVYMHSPLVRNDKYQSLASMVLVCWSNARFF